jgi:hypothetical protein
MTETKRICPYCQSPLEPAYAEMLGDFYECRTLLIDAYKAAFEGAVAAVRKEDYEYNRMYRKLREKVQQHNAIMEKYRPIIEKIRSKTD